MGPSNHPKEIVQNNYDDGGSVVNNPQMRAKVGYVVEVELDREAVEKVCDQRDVYLYKGNLDLNKHRHSIYRNPNTKKKELSTYPEKYMYLGPEEGTTVDYYVNKRQEFMPTENVYTDQIMKSNYAYDFRRSLDPDFTILHWFIDFLAPLFILGILFIFLKWREFKNLAQLSERSGERNPRSKAPC